MFVDIVKIFIKAGRGGDGAVSFHREKYVAAGGPDGGDGGRGGDVIFLADSRLLTLMDFRYRREYKAQNGGDGRGKKCTGTSGENLVIPSFSLYYVVAVNEYLRYSKDNSLAEEVFDKIEDVLGAFVDNMQDGLFEVLLVRNPKNLGEITECIAAFQNKTYNCKMVSFRSAKHVKVTMENPVDWTLDGERQEGMQELEATNCHLAIRLMVKGN